MKAIAKENLPQKICATCNRPFTWRKKWKDVWPEVKYCSEKCRSNKDRPGKPNPVEGTPFKDNASKSYDKNL